MRFKIQLQMVNMYKFQINTIQQLKYWTVPCAPIIILSRHAVIIEDIVMEPLSKLVRLTFFVTRPSFFKVSVLK